MSRSSMQSWWQKMLKQKQKNKKKIVNLHAKHRKSEKVSWLFDIFGIWRSINRHHRLRHSHKPAHTPRRHHTSRQFSHMTTSVSRQLSLPAYICIYIYLACACCQASLPHTRIYHIIWPQLACFRIKVALLLIHFTSPCLRGSNERCRRRDSGRHCSHKNCMRIHATPSTALTIRSLTLAFLPALSILLLSLCDHTAQVLLAFQIVQSTQKYLITKVIAFRSITHVCLCVCVWACVWPLLMCVRWRYSRSAGRHWLKKLLPQSNNTCKHVHSKGAHTHVQAYTRRRL